MNRLTPALLLLAGLLFAACSKDESPSAVPASNTLERGLSADPESLDPHRFTSVQSANVLRDIGEGLVGYSAAGEVVPAAASSWQVSEDGLTYTFSLRESARWSDGSPLLAEHFVYSFRRLLDPESAGFYGSLLSAIRNADAVLAGEMPPETLGVNAPDAQTLVIELEQPVPFLIDLLTNPATFPVNPAAVAEYGDTFTEPGKLLSNGAYKIESWEPGSILRLSRNEHYWNNAATAIDAVNYHVLPQEVTEVNRYRAGELHVTSSIASELFQQMLEEYPDEVRVASYIGINYFGFNLTRAPFADAPKLRQALSMAVDREAIVEKVTGRGEQPAYGWVPPGIDNYTSPQLTYQGLTQAERNSIAQGLFAEAGYGPDNPLQVELRYNTSDFHRRIAVAIRSMWQEVLGVETTLISEEFQVLLANMREGEVTQIFRSSWIGDYKDPHAFLSIMQTGDGSNLPRYSNPEFDELMDQAAAQTDGSRRRLLLEEAERVLLADHAFIPIYFFVSEHLVSQRVQGWEDNVLDYHYSQHLSLAPADAAR